MEQSTVEFEDVKKVLAALKDEKAQLEKSLETELNDSKREEIEAQIGEICADLEIHKIGLEESSSSQVEPQVRRSERERRPTEKMLELKRDEITRCERKFMSTCKL